MGQFTSPSWSKFSEKKDIQRVFSSIRHPQSNIVEKITFFIFYVEDIVRVDLIVKDSVIICETIK